MPDTITGEGRNIFNVGWSIVTSGSGLAGAVVGVGSAVSVGSAVGVGGSAVNVGSAVGVGATVLVGGMVGSAVAVPVGRGVAVGRAVGTLFGTLSTVAVIVGVRVGGNSGATWQPANIGGRSAPTRLSRIHGARHNAEQFFTAVVTYLLDILAWNLASCYRFATMARASGNTAPLFSLSPPKMVA